MKCLLFFVILALARPQAAPTTEIQPDMVVEIFRHGSRAPTDLKYDPSWPVQGELTPTGMREHYILGSALAEKYPNLLSKYDPRYIFVRSSNFNRTIMSLSSQLYGVFKGTGPSIPAENKLDLTTPPFADKALTDRINAGLRGVREALPSGFQPHASQINKKEDDRMLFVGKWNCAVMGSWQDAKLKDKRSNEIYEYLSDTVTELNNLGIKINSLEDLFNFGDTLIDNHFDQRELPKGIKYDSTLYRDSVFAFQWFTTYNYVGTGLERTMKALTVLDQIVQWFKGTANNTNELKFSFLSAHDTTLLPLLGLYQITNETCLFENYKSEKLGQPVPYPECVYPIFASQIMYEFYNRTEGPYVRFLYNGKPHNICKGDKFECSLEEFVAQSRGLLMNYVPKDLDSLCHDGDSIFWPVFWSILANIILVCIIFGLIRLLVKQRKLFQRELNEQRRQNNEAREDREAREEFALDISQERHQGSEDRDAREQHAIDAAGL